MNGCQKKWGETFDNTPTPSASNLNFSTTRSFRKWTSIFFGVRCYISPPKCDVWSNQLWVLFNWSPSNHSQLMLIATLCNLASWATQKTWTKVMLCITILQQEKGITCSFCWYHVWLQDDDIIWGFAKMVVPNNYWFPTKNYHFGVFWGYHHLRKHPYNIVASAKFWRNPRRLCIVPSQDGHLKAEATVHQFKPLLLP